MEPIRDERASAANGHHFADEPSSHHRDLAFAAYSAPHHHTTAARRRRHRRHKHKKDDGAAAAVDAAAADQRAAHADGAGDRAAMGPTERVQFLLDEGDEGANGVECHPLFTEMEELQGSGASQQWREIARWVKFEEDVEEGGNRWSKPHVATLSLHSLFELRSCLLNGTVILDLEADSFSGIIDIMLDKLVAAKNLEFMLREEVKDCLMLRKRHQYEGAGSKQTGAHGSHGSFMSTVRSIADIGKSFSHGKNLHHHAGGDEHKEGSPPKTKQSGPHLSIPSVPSAPKDVGDVKPHESRGNLHFFKKLPHGCEASNVLIGEVDFLSHHMAAFIRLKDPFILAELTEVPVPSRFLFVLLGPAGHGTQYREVGRAIATLMSDEVFHDVAYKARNRNDILDGVDEFLDQVTVLPPGEWDPNIRIEPPSHIPSQEKRKVQSKKNVLEGGAEDGGENGGGAGGGDAHHDDEAAGDDDEHGDPTLKRTGRTFGGLIADVRRKIPWMPSDYVDGVNSQCLAAFCFMYFALLAPIVTFGGLLEEATGQRMAAMENLLAGAVCGITYHVFSGQPLTIIGSTGPVLVFETIVFDTCRRFELDYLALRFWINCWMSAILLIVVLTDGSALVSYITRFTEESFATLIALIFIVEAVKKLVSIYKESINIAYEFPANANTSCDCIPSADLLQKSAVGDDNNTILFESVRPEWFTKVATKERWDDSFLHTRPWYVQPYGDYAGGLNFTRAPLEYCKKLDGDYTGEACYPMYDIVLMSTVLMFGTFILSMGLKKARNSPYFPAKVRQTVSDFAVMIAIIVMVGVDLLFQVDTPKLNVPREFKPTWSGRGWIVDPFGNDLWTIPAALIPALFGSILVFMDQQITAVIVNRKENKFKKGAGYHLDLLVISIQLFVVGLLGIPIYVAATVLSINHVNALKMESEACAPGEVPGFIGVREQRLTGVVTFIFIGLSVLLTSVLAYIPMPVLYGVFLYMGIAALGGIQLFDRLLLLIMPMKYQPDYMYLRHVPIKRVHLFTMFQVICLALLWIIKSIKSTSIFFPIMLVVMVGVRKAIEYIFTDADLEHLDQKMPELHLRKKDDAKKELMQAEIEAQNKDDDDDDEDGGGLKMKPIKTQGHLHIPMASGNVMKIPLSSVAEAAEHDEKPINISEEVNRSGLWKHIESQSSLGEYKKAHSDPPPAVSAPPTIGATPAAVGSRQAAASNDDDEAGIMISVQRPSPGVSAENVAHSREKQPLLVKGREGSPV